MVGQFTVTYRGFIHNKIVNFERLGIIHVGSLFTTGVHDVQVTRRVHGFPWIVGQHAHRIAACVELSFNLCAEKNMSPRFKQR